MLFKLYEEGSEKVESEFSMEKLLTTARDLKGLLKTKGLLTKDEQYELMFSNDAVINLGEDEEITKSDDGSEKQSIELQSDAVKKYEQTDPKNH